MGPIHDELQALRKKESRICSVHVCTYLMCVYIHISHVYVNVCIHVYIYICTYVYVCVNIFDLHINILCHNLIVRSVV